MHRCAVGAKESRAHEIVVISWALRWCVLGGVLLSRTLAGAVPSALSGLASGFGMDTGRFPVAVTTETIVRVVRGSLDNSIRLCCVWLPHTHASCRIRVARARVLVGLVVDRIVDARHSVPAPHLTLLLCRLRGGCGGGGCCLCRPISTSQLQPLPVFHFRPINPVVCWGPVKTVTVLWRPCLEDGFPLRCFQRLPVPNVANQPCPGRDNWHTRGSSVPVLSY